MTPVSHGKPCAGNPHARFDEGAPASEKPRRNALLHTVVFYMNCVSAHQLPLAREIVKLVGEENFRYVDAGLGGQTNQTVGCVEPWILGLSQTADGAEPWLESADLVLTGLRDLALIERRAANGLKTFYYSERWFKPIQLVGGRRLEIMLPGWMRMFVPRYRRMAKRFVKWVNMDPGSRVFAIGPWARKDFLRLGVRADKIVDWGYFVKPSSRPSSPFPSRVSCDTLRVLWAGRDIPLKHVLDIERAVVLANRSLLSSGQYKCKSSDSLISFTKLTGVTPIEVRQAMMEHDTFVFASNAFEGWGAVVSEALEEGMNVIGTYEAGASAAILPRERLYHAGDVNALALLLEKEYNNELPQCSIGEWTAKNAAKRLMEMI